MILPSLREGRPRVVLEALANSTAPILTDIPAHRELLKIHEDDDPCRKWLWSVGNYYESASLVSKIWNDLDVERQFWEAFSCVSVDTRHEFAEGVWDLIQSHD